jgi:hypothetical protein
MDKEREILKKLIADERRKLHAKDPMQWLEDCLGEDRRSFEWSGFTDAYKDHKWDGNINPLAEAWKAIARYEWVGIEAATGTSKTYMLARIVLWFLDTQPNSLVVTSAPKQDQLKLNLWAEIARIFHKFKKTRNGAELTSLRLRVDSSKKDENEEDLAQSWQAVGFVAGVGANEESATKAQGFHRENMLIIMEEGPGIANAIYTAFQNTCTGSKNVILAVGNPDNQHDPLHRFCLQDNVNHYRVSGLDFPNVVLNEEIFPGAVSTASIERRTAVYGEGSKLYNSRIRGLSPESATDSLIRLEWIHQCCIHKPEYGNDIPDDDWSFNACGIDVANSEGGDKASIAWFQKNVLVLSEEFYCNNTNDLAYNVIHDDYWLMAEGKNIYNTGKLLDYKVNDNRVGVDGVGVGAGTVNTFHGENYFVKSLMGGQDKDCLMVDDNTGELLYEFNNLRSQMYFQLREDLRNKEIRIEVTDFSILEQIISELLSPKLITGPRIAVESKKDIVKRIGYSPNRMDAIVYANWMRKDRGGSIGGISFI